MRFPVLVVMAILLSACAISGYKKSYTPYFDVNKAAEGAYEARAKKQEPTVIYEKEGSSDYQRIRAKRYVPLGISEFNGVHESSLNIVLQAKAVGATMVLVNIQKSSLSGGPVTSKTRFDQKAVFFVRSLKEERFGLALNDLNPEQKKHYMRDYGAMVDVVYEDTPAFKAKVSANDLLIAVNGQMVKSSSHGLELLDSIPLTASATVLSVIRNGSEQEIELKLN